MKVIHKLVLTHLNLPLGEPGKPFVFLDRGRAFIRKLQYQRVRECGLTRPLDLIYGIIHLIIYKGMKK